MKSILVLLALSCCSLLLLCPCSPAFAATQSTASVSSSSGDAGNSFDPYVGQGDLLSKAVPMCCCSTWSINCEDVPAGGHCNPNNLVCVCNGLGACVHE